MASDPAFLFYTSDFLTGTMLMSNEQIGMYIRLLCLQHQHGHLRERDMLKVCGGSDEDVFEKFIQDEEGLYYNERLQFEMDKRSKDADASRANGKRGGRPSAKPKQNLGVSSRLSKQQPKSNLTENEDVNINYGVTGGVGEEGSKDPRDDMDGLDEHDEAYRAVVQEFIPCGMGEPTVPICGQVEDMLVLPDYGATPQARADLIIRAMRRAAEGPKDKRSWRYVKGILSNWQRGGEGTSAAKAAPTVGEIDQHGRVWDGGRWIIRDG
jgi:DnaD and phage-associated domain